MIEKPFKGEIRHSLYSLLRETPTITQKRLTYPIPTQLYFPPGYMSLSPIDTPITRIYLGILSWTPLRAPQIQVLLRRIKIKDTYSLKEVVSIIKNE